ncbi:type IV pilin protein [Billgrantia kenyensis]|uniref:Type IV pilin protein n=1 Tax=Billgrantia kenyensis TaxID=321266 RepID=A0ABS9PN97_9GAMM|nr:type IV pilin protein [Halomonas kenyensis]
MIIRARPASKPPWHPTRARQRGFTLLELLIVVAVIGILASIAVPSYQRYVQNARVSDGQAKLLELAGRLERCYTVNNTYAGCFSSGEMPATSEEGFYSISFSEPPGATFTLVATGSSDEVKCARLELDHTGQRDSDNGCW